MARVPGMILLAGLLSSVSVLAGGAKTPEEAVQKYFKSVLAKNVDGVLSVSYIPDRLPTSAAHDTAQLDKTGLEKKAREYLEAVFDYERKNPQRRTESNTTCMILGTCIKDRWAVVISCAVVAGERGNTADANEKSTPTLIFLVKTEDGWKLPMGEEHSYSVLLPEDRKGEMELQWLQDWARKKIEDLKKQPLETGAEQSVRGAGEPAPQH